MSAPLPTMEELDDLAKELEDLDRLFRTSKVCKLVSILPGLLAAAREGVRILGGGKQDSFKDAMRAANRISNPQIRHMNKNGSSVCNCEANEGQVKLVGFWPEVSCYACWRIEMENLEVERDFWKKELDRLRQIANSVLGEQDRKWMDRMFAESNRDPTSTIPR